MSRPCAVCGGDHGTDEPVDRALIDCLTEALRQRHNPADCDDPACAACEAIQRAEEVIR